MVPVKKRQAVQMWTGSWYRLENVPLHQCCDCGLVHLVEHKLARGVIFERWTIDARETRIARAEMAAEKRKKR